MTWELRLEVKEQGGWRVAWELLEKDRLFEGNEVDLAATMRQAWYAVRLKQEHRFVASMDAVSAIGRQGATKANSKPSPEDIAAFKSRLDDLGLPPPSEMAKSLFGS